LINTGNQSLDWKK